MCLLGVMTFDLVFYLWFWGDYCLQLIANAKFSFRMISRKAFVELFSYCTHTSLRGCRCAFWGYDLWPNFLPLILRRLLTLIDGGWLVQFPDDISESICLIVFILHTHIPQGVYMCLFGVVTFDLIFTFDFEAIIDFIWWQKISFFSGW